MTPQPRITWGYHNLAVFNTADGGYRLRVIELRWRVAKSVHTEMAFTLYDGLNLRGSTASDVYHVLRNFRWEDL